MSNTSQSTGRGAITRKTTVRGGSIRLADLLPKKDVNGGGKVIFGGKLNSSSEKQSTQTKNQN
jgi:hypothetical protein